MQFFRSMGAHDQLELDIGRTAGPGDKDDGTPEER